MKIKKRRELILILFFILIIAIFSGCSTVQTHLSTSINHYQGGKTLGKDNGRAGLAFSAGQFIVTKVKPIIPEVGSDDDFRFDVETKKSKRPMLNVFFQLGILDRLDFIGEGYISIEGSIFLMSIGGRCNLKYQINDLNSRFGISLMPGIGYSDGLNGSTSSSGTDIPTPLRYSTNLNASSNAISLEFNVPMSYDITKDVAVHFGLNLSKYYYNVYSSYSSSGSSSGSFNESNKFSAIYFNPGFSFGFRFNNTYPEVRIDFVDDDYVIYFGLAFKFDKNSDKK
ncbi:MAG: hypothetical protein K8S23_03770 [Candidatus Cloacimonetes bacterium]|nr:hypothetical protein [Candidatus Cloacimonadota bacterium]